MANTLRQARILSSETDNTIKQEQNTNVNIKISKPQQQQARPIASVTSRPSTVPLYPEVPPSSASSLNNINFTPQNQPQEFCQAGEISHMQTPTFPSTLAANNQIHERGISDIGADLETLEKKNKFLEMIVAMYERNPIKINSYVVCESKLLMDMIKLLTEADKVEIVIDDSDVGCGCSSTNSKFIKVDKILVYKNNKSEDLKYGYNEIYTQFIRYGISLKLVV